MSTTERISLAMRRVIANAVLTNERIARGIGLNVVDHPSHRGRDPVVGTGHAAILSLLFPNREYPDIEILQQ